MPLSTCNQKEFLTESKLNGFWGVLSLLLHLAVSGAATSVELLTGDLYLYWLLLDLEIFIWEVK